MVALLLHTGYGGTAAAEMYLAECGRKSAKTNHSYLEVVPANGRWILCNGNVFFGL